MLHCTIIGLTITAIINRRDSLPSQHCRRRPPPTPPHPGHRLSLLTFFFSEYLFFSLPRPARFPISFHSQVLLQSVPTEWAASRRGNPHRPQLQAHKSSLLLALQRGEEPVTVPWPRRTLARFIKTCRGRGLPAGSLYLFPHHKTGS